MSDAQDSSPDQGGDFSDKFPLLVSVAAISIAESFVVLLVEKGLISQADAEEAFSVAIDRHLHAEPSQLTARDHEQVAEVIKRIVSGANAVRASARF